MRRLRILLVGNYALDTQQSMQRFAAMLFSGLAGQHEVKLAAPSVVFGKLARGGARKFLGYLDKYLLFPFRLIRMSRWADVTHVCDQGNGIYVFFLRRRPHLVTCHDVLAIRSAAGSISANKTRLSGRLYQILIAAGLRRARRIACVSKNTMSELLSLGGFDEDRVVVIPNGLNHDYHPMSMVEARQRIEPYGITAGQDFIFHVGGNQWYKNRGGLIEIFATIKPLRPELLLVLAGKKLPAELQEKIEALQLQKAVVTVGEIGNDDLRAFYSAAAAVIFPSLQEGFGWPIIEAQACGCPVFTTAREPMQSIAGPAGRYFDPLDPDSAAKLISEAWDERKEMRARGLENVTRFSRSEMVSAYELQYQSLAKSF